MTITQSSVTVLTLTIFILLISGFLVLAWGKKAPAGGAWLPGMGFLSLIIGVGLDSGILLKEEFVVKSWMVGWIGLKNENGAITVGVIQEPLSMAVCLLAAVVAVVLLLSRGLISSEPRPQRVQAGLAISTAGVALAWNSLTPWVSFVGLMLTTMGGFLALGSRWHSDLDAQIATRFIRERTFGFLLGIIGACIFATSRAALVLNRPEVWAIDTHHGISSWIGGGILVLGVFLHLQPFPLLGWVAFKSSLSLPIRVLLNQIFPAWAAFAFLLKLQPFLKDTGLLEVLGWLALASSLLTLVTGLFQKQWNSGLGSWLAAGFSLSVALLVWSGADSAMALLLGLSLGALVLASTGSMLSDGEVAQKSAPQSGLKGLNWIKVAAFLGASSGTGMVGFVSASGGIQWMATSLSHPGFGAAHIFVFFFFVLLGWKLAWTVVRRKRVAADTTWTATLLLYLWILLSLAILWTGKVTGALLGSMEDRVWSSAFDLFFGPTPLMSSLGKTGLPMDHLSILGLYGGILILALFTAYWTAGRKDDQWQNMAAWMPKTSHFLAHGYGIDPMISRVMQSFVWVGNGTERLIDIKIWKDWIPTALFVGTRSISGAANSLDAKLTRTLRELLKRWVEVPAALLQMIQTGDVRWYLFLALSSGFTLLLHFLKG